MTELEELKEKVKKLEERIEKLEENRTYPQQQYRQAYTPPVVSPAVSSPKKSESKDLEKVYSKNVLPVIASIFIFIGLIFFASVVLKDTSPKIQCFLMYILSFGILGTGFLFKKKDASTFGNILMGCGVGAVYVSIFATKIYFNLIPDLILFLLIASWSIFINLLANKLKISNFIKIGSLGISVSVILGSIGASYDWEFVFIALYFAILMISYFYFNFESNSWTDTFINSSFFIALVLYLVAFESSDIVFSKIIQILIPILSLLISDLLLLKSSYTLDRVTVNRWISGWNIYSVFIAPVLFSFALLVNSLINYEINDLMIVFIGIAILVIEFFILDNKFNIFIEKIIHISLLFTLASFITALDLNIEWVSSVFIILYCFYCIFLKKYETLLPACIMNIFNITLYIENPLVLIPIALLSTLLVILLHVKISDDRSSWSNIAIIINACFCIGCIFNNPDSNDIAVLVFGILLSLAPLLPLFDLDMMNKYHNIQWACTFMCMVEGISSKNILFAVPLILSFLIDKDLKNIEYINGFKKGIQLTMVVDGVIWIIVGFAKYGFVISLANIIISIISIILGIKFNNKSFRKYGLILSFISLAKLVFLDISYISSLQMAVAFILAGLFSFGIVKLYSKTDIEDEKKEIKD